MIIIGKWRWPAALGLSVLVGAALIGGGVIRMQYDGQALLGYSGAGKVDTEMKYFREHAVPEIGYERVPGQSQMTLHTQGARRSEVTARLQSAAQACMDQSVARRRERLQKVQSEAQDLTDHFEKQYRRLLDQQKKPAAAAAPVKAVPKAEIEAKIDELKSRRKQLIDRFPTHTDIPLLAKQIDDLKKQLKGKPEAAPVTVKASDLGRPINETKLRMDFYAQRVKEIAREARSLKPTWKLARPIVEPKRPTRVDGWEIVLGSVVAALWLGLFIFRSQKKAIKGAGAVNMNGLWHPSQMKKAASEEVVAVEEPAPPAETPVQLEVVSPNLPSDPLTEKAAALYAKWVEVSKILYTPAPEPPQGVLDQVLPLLQETGEYLPEGHDVLARYLARSVTPGDLPAHVARTVLMTLTGAQEAGVSEEHRLAMALAALFHDLAVVARPPAAQIEVGSEVGRLSAAVLRRISGLPPAMHQMVEDILVGMDEFKLETWQNIAPNSDLEPLAKVLREIDRFEKVLQKQKSRLDRRVANA